MEAKRDQLVGELLYAYVAGIIDGEGSIDIYKVTSPSKNPRYAMRLAVGSTSPWLTQFLRLSFGGSNQPRPRKNPKHKEVWIWSIAAKKAKTVLSLVAPYLQIKKQQAELALTFQSRKVRRNRPLSNRENILEEADRILMKTYNRRGKEVLNAGQ